MWKLLLFLAVLGGAAFFLSTNYTNRFNALKKKIEDARARLLDALNERFGLVKTLDDMLDDTEKIGRSAVASALKTAEKASISESIVEIGLLIGETDAHLERATMQLRNPNITRKTNHIETQLDNLEENSRQLKLARREFNNAVRDYNKMTQVPPSSWVATLFKYEQKSLCLGPHERSAD